MIEIYKYKGMLFKIMVLVLMFGLGFGAGVIVEHDAVYNDAKEFSIQLIEDNCPEVLRGKMYGTIFNYSEEYDDVFDTTD